MLKSVIAFLLYFALTPLHAALVAIDENELNSSNIIEDNIDGSLNENPIYTFGPGTVLYPANSNQLPRTGTSFVGPATTASPEERKISVAFGGGVDVFEFGAHYGNDAGGLLGPVDFWLLLWDRNDNYLGSNTTSGNNNDLIDQFLGVRSDVPLGSAELYMYQKFPSPGNISFVALDDFRIGYETGIAAVPLPAAGWLFASALLVVAGIGRRRASCADAVHG